MIFEQQNQIKFPEKKTFFSEKLWKKKIWENFFFEKNLKNFLEKKF